jgi:hypothetical protein
MDKNSKKWGNIRIQQPFYFAWLDISLAIHIPPLAFFGEPDASLSRYPLLRHGSASAPVPSRFNPSSKLNWFGRTQGKWFEIGEEFLHIKVIDIYYYINTTELKEVIMLAETV